MDRPMTKFRIKTLGCKVNQYESEVIAHQLQTMGCQMAEPGPGQELDVVVINTCTVTQKAAMQSRQATRQAIRAHPNARVIVTGCHAQINADELAGIKGVHTVIRQDRKHTLADIVATEAADVDDQHQASAPSSTAIAEFNPLDPAILGARTRPFLKIQDGCDAYCTYCIVPYTRGRSRSMPRSNVMAHIARYKQARYKEIVLTGIHLGCYGQDLTPPLSLVALLDQIHSTRAIERLRLSSIEPQELGDDLLDLVAQASTRPGLICNHFHIPMQSGDDRILKKMRRPYRTSEFVHLVERIRRYLPDAAVGVDVLAGFPGETDGAFNNTFELIKSLPLTYLHVFPFSSRPGTPAARFPDPVPADIIKTRCHSLRELGVEKKTAFYRQQLGKTVEILVEEQRERSSGLLKGLTSNYIPVLIDAPDDVQNAFVKVVLASQREEFMLGRIVDQN
jgi:threonylcarbamoyladenosine tRNA methylthiotransferase MtaB